MNRNPRRAANHAGRLAVIAHRLQSGPVPVNPWSRTAAVSRPHWDCGAEQANLLLDQLLEHAP